MVDLPAPEMPVNQTTPGRCPLIATRASLVTSSACQWMLSDRRSAKSIRPAPTVTLVSRSMSTKPPVSRFARYGSNGSRRSVAMLATAMSLTASVVAGVRSRVFTLMPCLMWVTVQVGGRAAELHQVRAAGQQRLGVHPDEVGLELVRQAGRVGRRR